MFTIFKTFFLLGWVSFGGPAAHIGYFRNTFVEKLKWLDDREYGQIVALSQFIPGPGSSQVGFAIGYKKHGLMGACLAFIGFTLPSVILMLILAILSSQLSEASIFQHIIHGLKLLAVVVVADACWGMYKSFCQHTISVSLCFFTAITLWLISGIVPQIIVLLIAALVGLKYLSGNTAHITEKSNISLLPFLLFIGLLIGLPLLSQYSSSIKVFSDFYQAGSLVFGGGHVVLPLLQNILGDQITQDVFLTGYAAAQAVPGPMFTFATYLGFQLLPSAPIIGALIATLGVFLPGFLLLLTVLNNWHKLASHPKLSGAIAGVNASVVGLLFAALYNPVFTNAVFNTVDIALVGVGWYLFKHLKVSIIWLVTFYVITGLCLFFIG
ncbi:chromate efflux transporter [Thalassotalea psychrophila]|uniref:Chromate efflux transporter n=1 Tax=Thalassotalea psychrophila TaxID=3065647 RepID=A0ABY9TP66_9GAMM|nr:chromate efflux transporter [Colwelliaceae bacterium SQ149]